MNYKWRTINGEEYEGEIVEIDSNVIFVKCTDGIIRATEGN